MIEYKGQLNLGNEILGTEKTITANEVVRTADTQALAREIHHQLKCDCCQHETPSCRKLYVKAGTTRTVYVELA